MVETQFWVCRKGQGHLSFLFYLTLVQSGQGTVKPTVVGIWPPGRDGYACLQESVDLGLGVVTASIPIFRHSYPKGG